MASISLIEHLIINVQDTSGEMGKLSLYLNVETYEHMIGPNKDSGIVVGIL